MSFSVGPGDAKYVRVGSPRSLRTDRSGNLLTLSGLLVVLGMVLMVPAIVNVVNLEDSTRRQQEGDFVSDSTRLLDDMNGTLGEVVLSGTQDVQEFRKLFDVMASATEEKAALAGLYASVSLSEGPALTTFQRTGRCVGYDPDTSGEGVVLGWEADTRTHGIAGAVADVHMTDGRNSLRGSYYVRFFECVDDMVYTHVVDAVADPGKVEEMKKSTKADDVPMRLVEKRGPPVMEDGSVSIDPDSFSVLHWTQPGNLHDEDGQGSTYPSNAASNHVRFKALAPPRMQPGEPLQNPELQVTAKHSRPPGPGLDQDLVLQVFHPADAAEPTIKEVIGPLKETYETFTVDLDESPLGGPDWTRDEIEDSLWELTVQGSHNPDRVVYVDHFNMTGGVWTYSAYRLDATAFWQEIPEIYNQHDLIARHRIVPGTPGESFRLEARDTGPGGNGTWWTVAALTDTSGAWLELELPLPLIGDAQKGLSFRVVDEDTTDNQEGVDRDVVEFDVLRVRSRLQ